MAEIGLGADKVAVGMDIMDTMDTMDIGVMDIMDTMDIGVMDIMGIMVIGDTDTDIGVMGTDNGAMAEIGLGVKRKRKIKLKNGVFEWFSHSNTPFFLNFL
ncbi:hypothetical protein GCM10008967_27530 [Bacillus carboniphilus]|uniref:Uncharacterized protein n=1 Tax=Bacillus carboniphilus TaxID=86663 RepID=A0ABN0WF74_9BACI